MKLLELFLNETTEEDRAIISLASSIWHEALKYKPKKAREPEPPEDDEFDYGEEIPDIKDPEDPIDEVVSLGKVKQFGSPLKVLDPIKIELQSDYGLRKRVKKEAELEVMGGKGAYYGLWNANNRTMTLNKDLIEEPGVRSAIAHELRHALDDYKSKFKAGASTRYWRAKDPSFRGIKKDPYLGDVDYLARPGEINARFVEVLNSMVPIIDRAVKTVPPEQLRSYLLKKFKDTLLHHSISYLFPQKEKSKDYKRLMKRGVDFIQKELQYQMQQK